jgi:hypothetical protein
VSGVELLVIGEEEERGRDDSLEMVGDEGEGESVSCCDGGCAAVLLEEAWFESMGRPSTNCGNNGEDNDDASWLLLPSTSNTGKAAAKREENLAINARCWY